MPYLDDDMSDLFSRASEDIRLRAEEDDWNKIHKRLVPDVSLLPLPRTREITQRNLILGIYLYFILYFGIGYFSNQPGSERLSQIHQRGVT